MPHPLVVWTARGLYCPRGDFYVDPHRPVDTAVVTHAHSDHARRGSRRYLVARTSVELMRVRLGARIACEGKAYGERFRLGDAWVSFHPAGHILGSAQVRIEVGNRVWVCSGDYKREPDPSCEPFETVECDAFITEATFGTPGYRWTRERPVGTEIADWWKERAARGGNALLFGYSLGKAQRILAEIAPYAERPVLIHATIAPLAECYRAHGIRLAPTRVLDELPPGQALRGELILAPPSVLQTAFAARLGDYESAFASGWMARQGGWNGRGYDRGFVISDHADWEDLNRTIRETRAREVYVQHRGAGALVRHLRTQGLEAHPIEAIDETRVPKFEQLGLFG